MYIYRSWSTIYQYESFEDVHRGTVVGRKGLGTACQYTAFFVVVTAVYYLTIDSHLLRADGYAYLYPSARYMY